MSDTEMIDAAPDAVRVIEDRPQPMAVTAQQATPAYLLQLAVQQGADLDRLERLMALQERWEASESRKAFVQAMTAFKAEPMEIFKRKEVSFKTQKGETNYKHAELSDVVDVVVPAMARHGLSHRWDVRREQARIFVKCILTHRLGHSESIELDGAPDDSGTKNNIQQMASTITYLQRYTLLCMVGLATKDEDDDGAGGGAAEAVPEYTGPLAALLSASINVLRETTNDGDALAFWKEERTRLQSDKDAYAAFKKACEMHRQALASKAKEGAA